MVAYANLARKGEGNFLGFVQLVLDTCDELLQYHERFVQTGVGWVLRELSRGNQAVVVEFLEMHRHRLSREALRNATKQLPRELAIELRSAPVDAGGRER